MKAYWLFLAALAILAPTAQAQYSDATQTLRIDADEFQSESKVTISGADAASYRQSVDQDRRWGNRDGTVSADEVAAYERQFTREFVEERPECFEDFYLLRIDGRPPVRVAYIGLESTGTEGPATSQEPLQHAFFWGLAYPKPSGGQATVGYKSEAGGFHESVECAIGFRIGSDTDDGEGESGITRFHPMADAKILKDSVRPTEAQDFWDGQGFRVEVVAGEDSGFPASVTFTIDDAAVSTWNGSAEQIGLILGYSVAGAAGLLAVGALVTEVGRYHLLKFLFLIPGFTRLEKDEVLEHTKREELYNFIKTNPGPSFSDLRRSLELSNGTLVHHLRILEAQEYIKAEREGFRTRFYVRGPKVTPTSYLTRTQMDLLEVIRAHPGLTQKELARLVGLPRQNLFYHTKQLAAQGKLLIKQDGNRRTYWLRATPAPSTPSVPPQRL